MLRPLVVLALCLAACDEEDPATSEHCVMVRMQWIEQRHLIDVAAKGGQSVVDLEVGLATLVNRNWQCFK